MTASAAAPVSRRFDAVLFDFHQTLTRVPDKTVWVSNARKRISREANADEDSHHALFLADLWRHAQKIDPRGLRDLSSKEHRNVAVRTMTELGGIDQALAAALYDDLPDATEAVDEALPVLQQLTTAGVLLGVVSNIGFDIRPILDRANLLDLLHVVVLSYEVGLVKPDPAIFKHAIESLGVSSRRTLMVGDSWHDDAGAAQLGTPTLILPPTLGSQHGLELTLNLVTPNASRTS